MVIDELEVEAGPLARWQVHWCDLRREVSWYAADPVLAGLPMLAEWAHAHGTQVGQPALLRADGWSVPVSRPCCRAGTVTQFLRVIPRPTGTR
ncbi:hypothetical protein [Streptomyces goshikiensis]|uniref:hypothetical protein n=1 Tax=Streptomyces goshikiensis TaxID=1942 RepID=UPI00340D4D38